jgi:hypothetical protein
MHSRPIIRPHRCRRLRYKWRRHTEPARCSKGRVRWSRPSALPAPTRCIATGPISIRSSRREPGDHSDERDGMSEDLSIDQSLHSPFGASKAAADILCQEYGRYFSIPVGVFRAGCLTGARHAAVEVHVYLNYIARYAVTGAPYTIRGYVGK